MITKDLCKFWIGGQIHNSTSYNSCDLEKAFLALKKVGANSVAVPIMWDMIEKTENEFDFSQLKSVVKYARANEIKLLILWFGSWKNGMSKFAPSWVKNDKKRFLFTKNCLGDTLANLSPISKNNLETDKKAFIKLCKEIESINAEEKTIIAVQVENEPGIIGSDRDYSVEANDLFHKNVPKDLITVLHEVQKGIWYEEYIKCAKGEGYSWAETFGYNAGEYFSAYHFAKYINDIAKAGKEVCSLPMYVNCWIQEMYQNIAGASYPSGGPVTKVLEIWRALTPNIDFIAPDIYVGNSNSYHKISKFYADNNKQLFVAESAPTLSNSLNMFRTVCDKKTIGLHVFAIDSFVGNDNNNITLLNDVAESIRIVSNAQYLLTPRNGEYYPIIEEEFTKNTTIDLGDYLAFVDFKKKTDWMDTRHIPFDNTCKANINIRGRGIINYRSNGEIYVVGTGFRITLIKKLDSRRMSVGYKTNLWFENRAFHYISVEEGQFKEGKFLVTRTRNGDETDNGIWVAEDVGVVKVVLEQD